MTLSSATGVKSLLMNGVKSLTGTDNTQLTSDFLQINSPNNSSGSLKISIVIDTDDFNYTRAESYLVNFRYKFTSNGSYKRGVSIIQTNTVDSQENGAAIIVDGTTSITSASNTWSSPANDSTNCTIPLKYNYKWNGTGSSPKMRFTIEYTGTEDVSFTAL